MSHVVEANGVRTYYTEHGQGSPVVLLHGGLSHGEHMAGMLPLSEQYRLVVPDRRGHGRTPDVPGPITYATMAADTVAFMERLDLAPAHLVGWSDGGIIGLLVALQHPELVQKLVLIGAYSNLDGCPEWVLRWYDDLTADDRFLTRMRKEHARLSPDGPDHFPVVFSKLIDEWRTQPRIELSHLNSLTAPTLLVLGDDDVVTPGYAAAMAQTIPECQLAVLPGTSHVLPFEKPDLLNTILSDFLADDQVQKRMPSSEFLAAH